jgi:short chain dehydrogenase
MSAQRERGTVAGAKALGGIIAALLAACGGLVQGFDTGAISNASASIVAQFHLTSGLQGVALHMGAAARNQRQNPRRSSGDLAGAGRSPLQTSPHPKIQSTMKLEGKVALVTGSAQGIGQAIAIRLAQEGADIIIDDRLGNTGALETRKEVEAVGRRASVIGGDLASLSDNRRLISEGIMNMSKIDILVNNAGVEKHADFWDVTEADFDFFVHINIKGTFFLTQDFVNHLRDTKRPGKIVNISSVH